MTTVMIRETIDVREYPDMAGEYLRSVFFDQGPMSNRTLFGCYSTFELRPGIVQLPSEPVEDAGECAPSGLEWTCAWEPMDNIKMRYWWDGDGTLEFLFPDGTILHNGDCKKDYVWEVLDGSYDYRSVR